MTAVHVDDEGVRWLYPRGIRMIVHPEGDYVSDEIARTGEFYEAEVLDNVAERLRDREPGIIVDVGAMIGNHSVYLAAFAPHTRIHAFEPLPANLELLRANVLGLPTVELHPHALSSRARYLRMRYEPENYGHARVDPDHGTVEVSADRLDDHRLEGVTLVKIDVEGHEPQVLAGAMDVLVRWRPLVMLEDWAQGYLQRLPPGYHLVESWPDRQTYLYAWE